MLTSQNGTGKNLGVPWWVNLYVMMDYLGRCRLTGQPPADKKWTPPSTKISTNPYQLIWGVLVAVFIVTSKKIVLSK
ncbi:hypothetical protein MRX96_048225 [Rhipicephalus microplus]